MPSKDPHDMVRLAAAASPLQSQIWLEALQRAGIHCQERGDYLDAGTGNTSGFSAEVWIEAVEWGRAEPILRELQGGSK